MLKIDPELVKLVRESTGISSSNVPSTPLTYLKKDGKTFLPEKEALELSTNISKGKNEATNEASSLDHKNPDVTLQKSSNGSLPVLIVNLSSLCGSKVDPSYLREATEQLTDQLMDEFELKIEELFDLGFCFQSDDISCEKQIEILIEASGGDNYVKIGYPPIISNRDTASLWEDLCRPVTSNAVNTTVLYLIKCGRSLSWKLNMKEELVALAEKEAIELENRKESSIEFDWMKWKKSRRGKLRRLVNARRTFQSRLDLEERSTINGQSENATLNATKCEIRKKIDQIDELIASLELEEIDEGHEPLLSDEEFSEDEWESKEDNNEKVENELTLIDRIAAMILLRVPRFPKCSDLDHGHYITECHEKIRKSWSMEFGRLPPS